MFDVPEWDQSRDASGRAALWRVQIAIAPGAPLSATIANRKSNSLRGIALMAAGMFLFSAADAMAKFLTDTMHPVQIVWCRQFGLLIGVLLLIAIRGRSALHTAYPKLQIARGALAAFSVTMFVIGVTYVPLADAIAITFVAPFILTVLGAVILGERVGFRRWTAVLIGFLGAMIIIRPGLGVVHPAAGFLVIAATAFALRQALSRVLAGEDKPQTTVAYTAFVSWALLSIPIPFIWRSPETGLEVTLLVGMALLAAVGETLVIMALDAAEAVVVAPVHYSILIWGTLYGYFIFGHFPDFWTWIGAIIIVATGIYTLNRERLATNALS